MRRAQYLRAMVVATVLISPVASIGCGAARSSAVSHPMDDATITTRVKTALLNEPGVNATAINVAADAGVVTLSGEVKSADEVQKAVAVARRIQGVRDVRSELKVGGQ